MCVRIDFDLRLTCCRCRRDSQALPPQRQLDVKGHVAMSDGLSMSGMGHEWANKGEVGCGVCGILLGNRTHPASRGGSRSTALVISGIANRTVRPKGPLAYRVGANGGVGKLARGQPEGPAAQYSSSKALHNRLGLYMEISIHFVGFPPSEHLDALAGNAGAKECHRTTGASRADGNIGWEICGGPGAGGGQHGSAW